MSVDVQRVRRADAADLIAANRESVAYHAPWITAFTDQAGFDASFARTIVGPNVSLIAREGPGGAVVGVVNLNEIVLGAFRSAYLSYWGYAGFGGRGLMTQALREAVRYAFDEIGLHRVEASIQPGNARPSRWFGGPGFRRKASRRALVHRRRLARPRALGAPRRRALIVTRVSRAARRKRPEIAGRERRRLRNERRSRFRAGSTRRAAPDTVLRNGVALAVAGPAERGAGSLHRRLRSRRDRACSRARYRRTARSSSAVFRAAASCRRRRQRRTVAKNAIPTRPAMTRSIMMPPP